MIPLSPRFLTRFSPRASPRASRHASLRVSFRLAFLLTPLALFAPLARAQNAAPIPKANANANANGFDKLFDAVAYTSKADMVGSRLSKLTDAEKTEQLRNVVSRNRRALVALREALQLPVQHPPVRTSEDDFGNYNGFRTLASILDQEAMVRALDRDFFGAVNSKLDCIELGVLMTRGGPLRAAIAGRDIEIIGRRDITRWVPRLEDDQIAAVAARLMRIETLRPPFAEQFRVGKAAAVALTKAAFDSGEWEELIKTTTKLDGQPFTEDEQATLQTIGQTEVVGGIERTFNAALADANAPYQRRAARVDYALDPWATMEAGAANSPALRVDYEAARVQNRLIALSLGLRTYRIKNGEYPETWETAPDPFASDAPLIYRRDGASYRLYSVGPNATDEGGKGLVVPQDGRIPANAGDDLVAPVLPL